MGRQLQVTSTVALILYNRYSIPKLQGYLYFSP